jgi:integrase
MSHLYKNPPKVGVYWLAFYENGQLYRKSLKTHDRTEAKAVQNEHDRAQLRGKSSIPHHDAICVPLLEEYTRFNEHRRTHRVNLDTKARIERFLTWGNIKTFDKINEKILQDYLNHRMTEPSTSRKGKKIGLWEVNNIIVSLKAWGNWAVKMKYIYESPIQNIHKYKIPVNPKRFLSSSEVNDLLKAAKKHRESLYPAVAIAIYTGMRQAEIFSLEWQDIDFKRKQITLQNKDGFTTKSKKFRIVPLHDHLRVILAPLRKKSGPCFDRVNQRRIFRRIVKKAGLCGIGWHTLRHTFASHLVMNGVDLTTVSKLLGHASISTTLIYSHLSKEHVKGAVEKLGF